MKNAARFVLIFATLLMLVEPLLGGWLGFGFGGDQHVLSPQWPAHARFHILEQSLANIFSCAIALFGLSALWHTRRRVRIGFALIPLTHFAAPLLALFVLSPLYGIANPIPETPIRFMGLPAGSWLAIIGMGLVILGLVLEWRARAD